MLKANEVVPFKLKNVVPAMCKGRTYVPMTEGLKFSIRGIAINVWPARGEDGDEMMTKDDKPITRRAGYFLINDDAYSSVSGYTAIEQLISCAPEILDRAEPGTYEVPQIAAIPVSTISVKEKMGKKEYDYIAFEPE